MDTMKETKIPDQGWSQRYDVVKELGDCHASIGNYDEAQEYYETAATLAPDEAGPYVGTGVIAIQQGRLDDAEIAFKVARRLDPECSKAYCGLAMVSQQRKKWLDAFEFYLKSLEFDNDNLTALLGLFQASCEMGSFAKVIRFLGRYLEMHPGDTSVMFCLATLFLKDRQPAKARELLLGIMEIDSSNADVANLLEEVEHILAQKN